MPIPYSSSLNTHTASMLKTELFYHCCSIRPRLPFCIKHTNAQYCRFDRLTMCNVLTVVTLPLFSGCIARFLNDLLRSKSILSVNQCSQRYQLSGLQVCKNAGTVTDREWTVNRGGWNNVCLISEREPSTQVESGTKKTTLKSWWLGAQ